MIENTDSSRISELLSALRNNTSSKNNEVHLYQDIAAEVYESNADKPEILRKAEFLTLFSQRFPADIHPSELIVGSIKFAQSPICCEGFYGNLGHIIVNYGAVLKKGIRGLKAEIDIIDGFEDRIRINKQAYLETLSAFSLYIKRYADKAQLLSEDYTDNEIKNELLRISEDCAWISEEAPHSFRQALQMVWFIHIFLHAEGRNAAVSFGRFDQYMYPYYKSDLENRVLSREDVKELLKCFWLKTCEGDESQNLTLGGDSENDLSLLCLEATRELQVWQPSVSVRISSDTSDAFWERTLQLIKAGIGMPALFNDSVVEQALINAGISEDDAQNYGIVGCYEANPQGKALGLTVAVGLSLHEILLDFLNANKEGFSSFDVMYAAFVEFLSSEYTQKYLPVFRQTWDHIYHHMPSPFESICLDGCLETGLAAEECGGKYTMFGVNVLGLGTTVDSLFALKRMVFDEKDIVWQGFIDEVANNFPDEVLMQKCKNLDGKYGTNSSFTDTLAHDLSERIAWLVLDNRVAENVITYPGLFRFLADIQSEGIPATPDGRCLGDRISYGIGASDYCCGRTPTSVLNSSAQVANDLCACGNPLMLSFSKNDVECQKGNDILKSLIKSYFDQGGFHLQFNIVDANMLEDAKLHPEMYGDLLIRISGFSARFTTLDSALQDAIIERTRIGE